MIINSTLQHNARENDIICVTQLNQYICPSQTPNDAAIAAVTAVADAEVVTNAGANDADEFVMTWSHLFSVMSYATPGNG